MDVYVTHDATGRILSIAVPTPNTEFELKVETTDRGLAVTRVDVEIPESDDADGGLRYLLQLAERQKVEVQGDAEVPRGRLVQTSSEAPRPTPSG